MWEVIIGGMLLLGAGAILGYRIGQTLFPDESLELATAIGVLVYIASLSIAGTIVYYIAPVTVTSLFIALLVVVLVTFLGTFTTTTPEKRIHHANQPPYVLILIAILSIGAWWSAIIPHQITDAVRSPWQIISPISILAPALAIIMSTLTMRVHKSLGSILLFVSIFSVFASAAILFPLGYGFDSFLHRATILHIAEYGTITPKPLYYIGEYALTLYAHLIAGVQIFTIDIFLVPLLGALAFTVAIRRLPIGIALWTIALGNFIVTTPQSLGYIFTLLAITTSASQPTSKKQFIAPAIFAIAACAAHPIAGAPALLFVALTAVRQQVLRGALILASVLILPGMFILQALLSHATVQILWSNLFAFHHLPLTGFFFTQGNPWLDALYLVATNLVLLTVILGIFGAYSTRNAQNTPRHNGGIMAIALFSSFILVSLGIHFTYLIPYERQDFALRILFLAVLFALPLIDAGIAAIASRLAARRLFLPMYLLGGIALCASLYTIYPRHDGYARSAAFNVSQTDINTVYAIASRETPESDYIVLANQATSSAALQEFGFRKYYHDNIFYYPIPTGGALYQDYLAMVETRPSLEIISHAMQTTGVRKVYFVVSDYWWQSDAIIEHTKQLTDDWFAVDEGKATVFIFSEDAVSERLLQ